MNSGISWIEIQRQIKEERKSGNPYANLIYKLNLDKNNIQLMLDSVMEDPEEDQKFQIEDTFLDNCDPVMLVDVDINLTC